MIDLSQETLLALGQAAKLLPPSRSGKPTSPATLSRWIMHGVGGVRLEAVRFGSKWATSAAAVQRFADALTAAKLGPRTPTVTRTQAHARAEAELIAQGF